MGLVYEIVTLEGYCVLMKFELPTHPMCLEHRGLLISLDLTIPNQYVDFDQVGLKECPEVLVIGTEKENEHGKPRVVEVRYRYQGVQDGRAVYREEDGNGK